MNIYSPPDPTLLTPTNNVEQITPETLDLIHEMISTMREAGGIGLAANQVGHTERIAVIQLNPQDTPMTFINPRVTIRRGKRETYAGCLSLTGIGGVTQRSMIVTVTARNIAGKQFKLTAQELLAQVIEHETDHLDGILFTSRLVDRETL